jgi:hypothetical protein
MIPETAIKWIFSIFLFTNLHGVNTRDCPPPVKHAASSGMTSSSITHIIVYIFSINQLRDRDIKMEFLCSDVFLANSR